MKRRFQERHKSNIINSGFSTYFHYSIIQYTLWAQHTAHRSPLALVSSRSLTPLVIAAINQSTTTDAHASCGSQVPARALRVARTHNILAAHTTKWCVFVAILKLPLNLVLALDYFVMASTTLTSLHRWAAELLSCWTAELLWISVKISPNWVATRQLVCICFFCFDYCRYGCSITVYLFVVVAGYSVLLLLAFFIVMFVSWKADNQQSTTVLIRTFLVHILWQLLFKMFSPRSAANNYFVPLNIVVLFVVAYNIIWIF